MITLALRTGIAPSVWRAEDERTIETAWQLLQESDEQVEDAIRDAKRRSGR
jgi:hypothetical protein